MLPQAILSLNFLAALSLSAAIPPTTRSDAAVGSTYRDPIAENGSGLKPPDWKRKDKEGSESLGKCPGGNPALCDKSVI